ncbi:MAG: hypothetical protein FJ125_02645, partial [Deltaproteobacteria bacterium]|nr:hypothetical protein [Deltaproteobacteria bacterium]
MPGSHIAQTSFFPLGAAAVCSLLLLGWLAPALPGCAAVDPGAGFGNAADGGMAADGAGPPDGGGGGAGGGEDGEDGEDGGGTGARDDAGGLRPADGGCPGAEPACALATGVCLGARRTCRAGVWQPCTIADYTAHHPAYSEQETAALCDELDNDCDGRTDEACSCRPGEVRACGTDEGECQAGSERCAGGRWGGACEGAVNPAAEGCNGLDDDCDGQTDEGCACRD